MATTRAKAKTKGVQISRGSTHIQLSSTKNADRMTAALKTKDGFKDFAADPKTFAAKYGVTIDQAAAVQLKRRVAKIESVSGLKKTLGRGPSETVAAVVVVGAAAPVSAKVAVAF